MSTLNSAWHTVSAYHSRHKSNYNNRKQWMLPLAQRQKWPVYPSFNDYITQLLNFLEKKKNSNRISSLPQNKQFQWYNLEGVSFSDFKAVLNGDSVAGDKRLKEKLFSRKSNGLGLTNLGSTSSLPLGNCKSSKS